MIKKQSTENSSKKDVELAHKLINLAWESKGNGKIIKLDNITLEQVGEYKYLRSLIDKKKCQGKEANTRMNSVSIF